MEQALARARAEASELRRMVEVQEAAMATAAARHHKSGDAVAYAATLERWRQEVFAGAVRRRIHADQGVHLHAARRAAADAIRTAALCERRWRAAQAHAARTPRGARARTFWGGSGAAWSTPVETRSTRCGATPNGAKPR